MWYYWVIIGIVFLILVVLFISLQIAFSVVTPKKRSLEKTRQIENNRNLGLMEFYDSKMTDQSFMMSRYGYKLRLYYFVNEQKSNKYVVMAHGHTYTHHGCIKYAKMMYNKGFNVILYDERYHGNSGGDNTTLGYFEKDDLYDVISEVEKRFGKNIFIGTYGESMGAVTALLEQDFDERVKFVVSDCGFESLSVLLMEIFKRYKLFPRKLLLKLVNFFVKIIAKMSVFDVNPIDALDKNNIPILFVHGENDHFIPYHHSQDMYEKYQGPKMFLLGKNNARHVESYPANVEEYEKTVSEFLDKYVNPLMKGKSK